ncbi:hypothetical protein BJ912DRAFT_1014320, partial [Pholiota molesta]
MVTSPATDIYSPFQPQIMSEEGHQSSEEGSGLHSPVFGAPYPTHGDSFRYSDVQHNMGAQYDYGQSLAQQPPILHDIELPNSSSAQRVTFSNHYSLPPRNQLGIDFSIQPPVTSRIPAAPQPTPHVDFRYSPPTERRLPGGPSHEHSYTRPLETLRSPAADASTSPRESRKEISSVVIACRQCRSRKIRCDSTRPVCNNCVRRSNPCEYDAVPKRRGPDKRPGTRQRSCKKRPADGSAPPPPKRKRPTTTTERPTEQRELPPSRVKENLQQEPKRLSPTASRHLERHHQHQDPHYPHPHLHPNSTQAPQSPTDLRMPSDPDHYKHDISASYRRPQSYMYDQGSYTKSSYPRQLDVNTLQFPDTHHRNLPIPISPSIETEQKQWWDKILKTHDINDIAAELSFLEQSRLLREDERLRIQPSFILAILAMAKLMKSSSMEDGLIGLQHAMMLAQDAHTAFETALQANWVDPCLPKLLFLTYSARATDALITLDNLIRSINLTIVDKNDHDVSLFSPNRVPMILCDSGYDDYAEHAQDPSNHYSSRPYMLPWDPMWNPDESDWKKLGYVARCEAFNEDAPRFFICDPANFALLFPGEVMDRLSPAYRTTDALSPKESVWGLYCRSMLLWNFCNRFRTPSQDEERAEQAQEAFLEAQALEDSLNSHQCNLDTTLIYTTREYIHNTRMLVAQALRSFHGLETSKSTPGPIFKRKQAEDWCTFPFFFLRHLYSRTTSPAAHQLTRRPYRINWFINQLAICLVLWTHDPTLDDALKLAKSILIPIDVLNALWPCPAIQGRCDSLRQQLIEACTTRNIELPFPPSYT